MLPRPTHVQGTSLGPVSVRGCLQRQMPPAGQGRLSLPHASAPQDADRQEDQLARVSVHRA